MNIFPIQMESFNPPPEANLDYSEVPDPEFKLKKAVVCWLDLLGLTDQLGYAAINGSEDAFVARYLAALRPIYAELEYDFDDRDFNWNAFTDTIVLSVPLAAYHPETTIGVTCSAALKIQFRLSSLGWFLRGSVAVGPLFASKQFVVGSGMLSAYKMEEDDAVFPRVIVDRSIREIQLKFLSYYAQPEQSFHNNHCVVDEDQQVFLNYLYAPIAEEYSEVKIHRMIAVHRDQVLKALERHQFPGKLRMKYLWTASYHNWFCNTWLDDCPSDLLMRDVPARNFRTLVPLR